MGPASAPVNRRRSAQRSGRDGERDFHVNKRSNETHGSTTDPDARLSRKAAGREAKLAYTAHLPMDIRNGLGVETRLTQATGAADTQAACDMVSDLPAGGRITVGADKAYDTAAFVARMRDFGVTPQVAQNINAHRGSNIDARTIRLRGLSGESGDPHTDRRSERLDQMRGGDGANQASRAGRGWLHLSAEGSGLELVRLPKLIPTG